MTPAFRKKLLQMSDTQIYDVITLLSDELKSREMMRRWEERMSNKEMEEN